MGIILYDRIYVCPIFMSSSHIALFLFESFLRHKKEIVYVHTFYIQNIVYAILPYHTKIYDRCKIFLYTHTHTHVTLTYFKIMLNFYIFINIKKSVLYFCDYFM